MSSTVVECPGCRRPLGLPEEHLDSLVRCPLCGDSFLPRSLLPPADDASPEGANPPSPRKKKKARLRGRFEPFTFAVRMEDPVTGKKQSFVAEVDPDGLYLSRADGTEYDVPIGTWAEHLGGGQLRVEVDGLPARVTITQPYVFKEKLARALVEFLAGELVVLNRELYFIPQGLYLIIALPWALVIGASYVGMILAELMRGHEGAILAVLGLSWLIVPLPLSYACHAIIHRDTWTPLDRAVASLSLIAVAFGVMACLLLFLLI